MILIVDNNEIRRKDILVKLRIKGYTVSTAYYDELIIKTKPFLTVYINPTKTEASKINNNGDLTLIFSDRTSVRLPLWSININSLMNIPKIIEQVFLEKCPYNKPNKVDITGLACMKNGRFALAGRIIKLSSREQEILRFFMSHPKKRFNSNDASSYIRILANQEENYRKSVSSINLKAKRNLRFPIIMHKLDWYYLNPEIANYICDEYEEREEYDTAEGLTIINVNDEF